MNKLISKTIYLEYLNCPKSTWFKIHKPELKALFESSDYEKHLAEQGYLVEDHARKLFPAGIVIEQSGNDAIAATQQYVKIKTPVLFQSTFAYDVFLVRNDILVYDDSTKQWQLYEIKSTNSTNENTKKIDHIEDASFQSIILQEHGIELSKIYIIHLNGEYALDEQIDANELFSFDDVTEKVKDREQSTRLKMQEAKQHLLQSNENQVSCLCIYKGRKSHCPTFKYSNMHVPDYSVHDIARINKKKLERLVDMGCFKIDDIPESFDFSKRQKNQVRVYQQQSPFIDIESIKKELNSLQYPLYFFDYETFAPAIPLLKGFRPYERIPFQFSLHVLNHPDGDLRHFEYLHETSSDPSLSVIQKLKKFIDQKGTVIVWYKPFETGVNTELAKRCAKYKEFLENLNARIYDLMDIFNKQMYIHSDFKGSSSIKNVLPVICPELSYKELVIQEGTKASIAWYDMIYREVDEIEKQKIIANLKKYCRLDTYAMYKIWQYLMITCNLSCVTKNKTCVERTSVR